MLMNFGKVILVLIEVIDPKQVGSLIAEDDPRKKSDGIVGSFE
jgi:hypothetical protein